MKRKLILILGLIFPIMSAILIVYISNFRADIVFASLVDSTQEPINSNRAFDQDVEIRDCSGLLLGCLNEGRNKVILITPYYLYTLSEFLSNFKPLDEIISIHHQNQYSGSIQSTYLFFDQISGKKTTIYEGASNQQNSIYLIDTNGVLEYGILTEVCDGRDNDCDGQIDEDFDFLTDPNNCGACNCSCSVYPHAETSCINGECVIISCKTGWQDLDENFSNGCEHYEPRKLYVNDDGYGETVFQNIQDALYSASNGDMIIVDQGTYIEDINFLGKEVIVKSNDPNDQAVVASTIINGTGEGNVVTFAHEESNSSILCGLTIKNGNADNGGGIYCYHSSPTIDRCFIINNESKYDGGGIYCNWTQDLSIQPSIKNCVLTSNLAMNGSGGGIHCRYSSPCIVDCAISANRAKYDGGGIFCGWTYELNIQPRIEGCKITDNSVYDGSGGGVHSTYSSTNILDCLFNNNEARYDGGGIFYGWSSYLFIQPKIMNCTINNNIASSGGGIYCRESPVIICNNVIYKNSSDWGGGICFGWCSYSSIQPKVINCVIHRNLSHINGGGICSFVSSPIISNCISRNNSLQEIYAPNTHTMVTYSNIQGGYIGGIKNIDTNPLFTDPNKGDFHLQSNSPCINAGNPEISPNLGAYMAISDIIPPEIFCPFEISAFAMEGLTKVDYKISVADNLDPYPIISYSHPPNSLFPLGTTQVNVTTKDKSGNSNQCFFNVTIQEGCYVNPNSSLDTKEFNLEVVFYDVTSCYVADICEEKSICDTLTDYRDPSEVIMTFKDGTLRTLDKDRADSYGYGTEHSIKKCVSSQFSDGAKEQLKEYVERMSDLIFSWSESRIKIVPHFHSVKAEMGSGEIPKDNSSPTGHVTGKNPSPDQFIYYAKKAGVDLENMDLFIGFTNPYPNTGSENDGLLIQSYCGEVSGILDGIPMTKLAGMSSVTETVDRNWLIAALIHELIHTFNIGHYQVSGFEDVYGLEGASQHPYYNPKDNPRPHCTDTAHYDPVTKEPDPYKYFPDSYNWLDPMWNENPYEPLKQDTISYCLANTEPYPSVNPLDPNDHYEDIADLYPSCKYYKFIFQAHCQDSFAQKLYTSYCKNCRLDIKTLDYQNNFEYEIDLGGNCLKKYYHCRENGIFFELGFETGIPIDKVNNIPLKNENVIIKDDLMKGKVGVFGNNRRILISGAEMFADSHEFTIEVEVKFDEVAGYQPLVVNLDRYHLFVEKGYLNEQSYIGITVNDGLVPYDLGHKEFKVTANINTNIWYKIKVILEDGRLIIFLDEKAIGATEDRFFKGKFMYQNTSDHRSHIYIGNHPGFRWLHGEIRSVTFYNSSTQ